MKSNKEKIYDFIKLHANETSKRGVTTEYISKALNIQRTNVSSILNILVREKKITKFAGRPVIYDIPEEERENAESCFRDLIGYDDSLKSVIKLAKAAALYPQKNLNALIIGAKGTGKKSLTKSMYNFALKNKVVSPKAKFLVFKCKEYSDDEQRAMEALFGSESQEDKQLL